MSKRVYELAKDLSLSSRDLIAALASLGVVAKSHSSTVEDAVVAKLVEAQDKGTLRQLIDRGASLKAVRPSPRAPAQRPAAERTPSERPPAERRAPPPKPEPAVVREAAPAPVQAPAPVVEEPAAAGKAITVPRGISVQELASRIGVAPTEIVKKLFLLGETYTVTQSLSDEAAELVLHDYGYEAHIVSPDEEVEEAADEEEAPEDLAPRPPVITVMGHVDHGKTLLLDKIRSTDVVASEFGGITQHIGAYQVHRNAREITFIDTPGHEAFTAMRARGAKVTDIAVLVVAADDGVKPQTVEALAHAKAAAVPIVVAVNKIDKPEADAQRVRQQLTEHELVPEEWGGDTPFVEVSAKTGQNIDDLLDVLLLVADIQEMKANPKVAARGFVIEAHLDKGRGPVATVLVHRGTLRAGDAVVAGTAWARVRALLDDAGRTLREVGPGSPAQVLGFGSVPEAGDEFRAVADDRTARQTAQDRLARRRAAELVSRRRVTLEDLAKQAQEGVLTELNVILKADVQGSLEAVQEALEKLKVGNVGVRVLHRAAGAITENDVTLAQASGTIVVGFNVRPDPKARALAEREGVDVRTYQIIYKLVEDIEAALRGMLAPEFVEEVLGRAQVRATFRVPKIGVIAGCYVDDGAIRRGAKVRLLRDGVVMADTTVSSLRRFKDDAREVTAGYECGIGIEGYQDIKEGDALETYEVREVPR